MNGIGRSAAEMNVLWCSDKTNEMNNLTESVTLTARRLMHQYPFWQGID
jgi:hypothetical protein